MKLGSKMVQITGGRDVEASAEVEVAGRKETLNYKARGRPERERFHPAAHHDFGGALRNPSTFYTCERKRSTATPGD